MIMIIMITMIIIIIITTTTITIIINVTNKRINILITVLNIIITMGASNEFKICCDLFVQRASGELLHLYTNGPHVTTIMVYIKRSILIF